MTDAFWLRLPPMKPLSRRETRKPEDPWLVRPRTIRRMWIGSLIVMAGLVALDFALPEKAYFADRRGFGFAAWYGFAVCAGFVAAAKLLGIFLKVRDDYYDD